MNVLAPASAAVLADELLERAVGILLRPTVTESDRALADSCRDAAKELRLAALYVASLDAKQARGLVDGRKAPRRRKAAP